MKIFSVFWLFLLTMMPLLAVEKPETDNRKASLEKQPGYLSPDSIDQMLNEYTRIQLPPLQEFLESAMKHASINVFEALHDEQKAELKATQREWMNYLSVTGIYQYGHVLATTAETATDLPIYVTSNGITQSTYNIGLRLSVPIGDLVGGQKNRVRAQKARLRRVEYEYELALEQRKLTILEAYNEVVKELAVLSAKSDAAALYNAQMRVSEQAFINGKIDIITLSLERSRRTSAIVTYQEGKASLQNAITRLEMLTNIAILNR